MLFQFLLDLDYIKKVIRIFCLKKIRQFYKSGQNMCKQVWWCHTGDFQFNFQKFIIKSTNYESYYNY